MEDLDQPPPESCLFLITLWNSWIFQQAMDFPLRGCHPASLVLTVLSSSHSALLPTAGWALPGARELLGKAGLPLSLSGDLHPLLDSTASALGWPCLVWLCGAFPYLCVSLKLNTQDIYKLHWEWTCRHQAQVSCEPSHYLIMLVDVEEQNHLNMDQNSPWLHLYLWEIITLSSDTYSKSEDCHLLLLLLADSSSLYIAFHLSSKNWISLTYRL